MNSIRLALASGTIAALAGCATSSPPAAVPASSFKLASTDIAPGKPYPPQHMLNTFGCTGGNVSPQLSWSGAPEGTKSFVLTMYDPDAPTGSGWWHWTVYNLPASATGIAQGGPIPAGAMQAKGDGGQATYGGPCPPQGAPAHRYVFTVHALKVDKLPVPPDASPALIGFMTTMSRIGQASFTVDVGR